MKTPVMEKARSLSPLLLFIILVALKSPLYAQNRITNARLNYEITLPGSLAEMERDNDTFLFYADTSLAIALTISGRESTFTNVNNYLDCSKHKLEQQLQEFHEDSTLKMLECRRSVYYPEQGVVLHIETVAYFPAFDRCFIYFFHSRAKDLQFFFLYKKAKGDESMEYIDKIMRSVHLL